MKKAAVLVATMAMAVVLAVGPAMAIENLITGTSGDDVLWGTAGGDRILALQGHDDINGRSGNDRILGGANDDTVVGGSGRDVIFGDSGRDTLNGGPDKDYLNAANRDHDFVNCGAGVDLAAVDPQDMVNDNCERVETIND